MNIKQKLILGFSAIAFLVGCIGGILTFDNQNVQDTFEQDIYCAISQLNSVQSIITAQHNLECAANNYLLLNEEIGLSFYFEGKKQLKQSIQKYSCISCEHVKSWMERYNSHINTYYDNIEQAFELKKQDSCAETIKQKTKQATQHANIAKKHILNTLAKHINTAHIDPARQKISDAIDNTIVTATTASIATVILAIALGLIIARSVSNPIIQLSNAAIEIGNGRLDTIIKIKSKDEIGQLADSLRKMTKDLTVSIDNLNMEISYRKKAENNLKAFNKDLETTIKELDHSNRELKNFTHMMAHDLKTPLRAIATLVYWLSTDYSSKFDEPGREKVKILLEKVKQINKLLDGALKYSEIKNTGQNNEIDLNLLLEKIIKNLHIPSNIEMAIENNLPNILSKNTHMTLVFEALLSNAVKYMDKPKGHIKISAQQADQDWIFSVADNGCGIDEKYHDKIFQMFQRLYTYDEIQSIGIGLSLVKKTVEIYAGRIWVESEQGKGSTFYFSLPAEICLAKKAVLSAGKA